MFNDDMYTRLIAIISRAVKQAMLINDNFEVEFVSLMHSVSLMFVFFCLILLEVETVVHNFQFFFIFSS